MHFLVGQRLLEEDLNIASQWTTHGEKRAMVIVETRPTFWLPYVIANAVRTVGWKLYIFATHEIFQILESQLTNITYCKVILPRMDVNGYSRLLISKQFWDAIQEEHILIFQSDCYMMKAPHDDMLTWSYIGPLCGNLTPDEFIMNGGLSLRKKTDMLRACELLSAHDQISALPEDIAFTTIMRKNPHLFKLPDMETCFNFAIESFGNLNTAVGIHGTDKYYAPESTISALCRPK